MLSGATAYAATHGILIGSLGVFRDQPLRFAVVYSRWLHSCTLVICSRLKELVSCAVEGGRVRLTTAKEQGNKNKS
jgi:hypothetical protein